VTIPASQTVIVVGAGLAGLSAALDLHHAGWRVTVLEARSRVGGRVWTIRDSLRHGQYAEGGGEFINADHGRMLALAGKFGLALDRVDVGWEPEAVAAAGGEWAAFEGRLGRERDVSVWGCDLAAGLDRIWEALAALGEQVPDPARPTLAPDAAALDARSAADWLNGLDAPAIARLGFASHLRAEYTVEAARFSLLDLARNASLHYRDRDPRAERRSFRIRGGNDGLPRAMAADLPDVRLDAPVVRVSARETAVAVTYQTTSGPETITGDYAILAIPLTTARRIEFDPPLPPAHAAMVAGVSYGSVTKVLLQYRRRWWHARGWSGRLMNDAPLACTWEPTEAQPGEAGVLTVYTGGAPGEAFARLSDDDRIAAAAAEMERLFPGSRGLLEGAATVAWPNETYTRGAYMALAPGEVTRFWETLFTPAGRLFFAGEHAAVFQGYMEGAVESGERVAEQIRASV